MSGGSANGKRPKIVPAQSCSPPGEWADLCWQNGWNGPRIPGIALWEWRVEEGVCLFSPEWYKMLGIGGAPGEPEDPCVWWGRVHPDDREEVQNLTAGLLDSKTDRIDVTYRMKRADGCWAWLLVRGVVVEKRRDLPLTVFGTTVDVSPLRADPKFQQDGRGAGNNGYHAMLENSPNLLVRMDRELFPLYMNPKVVEYMGRDRHEYTYTDSLDELKVEPEQLAFLQRNVERVFAEGAAIREPVSFRSPATGKKVVGEYSFWPEYDAEGNIVSAMTQFCDTTGQAEAEERARLNERRLADLYHLTQLEQEDEDEVLGFVMNSLLRLTASSSAFIFIPDGEDFGRGRMLWSADHYSFIDAPTLEVDHFPDDMVHLTTEVDGERNYRSVRNGDGVNPVHISFDGKMPVIRSMIAPAKEGDKIVFVAGVCNKEVDYEEADLQQLETFINSAWLIMRRRRFVRELARARDAAQHASKVKDEFLANVSHELRTPLNGLLSMLQLLDGRLENRQHRDYVRVALQSSKTLLRIISDILDFSRMESGKMQLEAESFDYKAAVCSTISLFADEAERKGLALGVTIDPWIPDCLLGDEARVRQILFNLLGNALKFTESGTISVHCSLLPADADGKIRIYMTVADTGIGIAQEKLDLIFDPFMQADSSTTRKYGGTGLGLGIVKRLVDMMQGSVAMESEEGVGTTVHCSMVFEPSQEDGLVCAPDAYAGVEGAAGTDFSARPGPGSPFAACAVQNFRQGPVLDILVAEDDAVSRFAMRAFIERAGHRCLCAVNGVMALEALRHYAFDCVLTDIQMPDMDGMELVRVFRSGDADKAGDRPESLRGMLETAFPNAGPDRSGPTRKDVPFVVVSAHAMAGDSERFLQQGVDYYLAKPVIMARLQEVLERIARGAGQPINARPSEKGAEKGAEKAGEGRNTF